MMPLKTFHTRNRYGEIRISFLANKIKIQKEGDKPYHRDYEKVFVHDPFSLSLDMKTEYEITKTICKLLKNRNSLSYKAKQKLDFYELYNPELCESFEYEHTINLPYTTVKQKLSLNPFGLKIAGRYGEIINLKPDRIFFAGPYSECLPIEIRKYLKQTIFNSLENQNKICLNDGFPILDYEELYSKNYNWHIGNWNKGAEFIIRNGYIEYNGWSGPREGGGKTFGIEWFLHYEKNLFNLMTNHEFDNIYEDFCTAVLKHEIN